LSTAAAALPAPEPSPRQYPYPQRPYPYPYYPPRAVDIVARHDLGNNGDVVAASMTAGLWAGFGLGIMITKDSAPDPRFSKPDKAAATASKSQLVPWVSANGTLGLMTGGTF
jgi:hypothetical protein